MNPECLEWQEKMLEPDALAPAARAALDCHLAACPACRRMFEDFAAMQTFFIEFDNRPVPPSFAADVMAAVHRERWEAVAASRQSTARALRVLGSVLCLEIGVLVWTPLHLRALVSMMFRQTEALGRQAFSALGASIADLAEGLLHALPRSVSSVGLLPFWTMWVALGLFMAAGVVAEMKGTRT